MGKERIKVNTDRQRQRFYENSSSGRRCNLSMHGGWPVLAETVWKRGAISRVRSSFEFDGLGGVANGAAGCSGKGLSGARQPHRFHDFCHTEQRNHPLEVISQHLQAHFGAHVLEASREEVCRAHPVFQGSEHLDGAPT